MRVRVADEQIAEAIDALAGDPRFQESVDAVLAGGRPGETLQTLSLHPEILEGFGRLSEGLYPGGIDERDLKELVILESSRQNACMFCSGVRTAMARSMGMSDEPLDLSDRPEAQTENQRLALEYKLAALEDSNKVPAELFARLQEAFTDPEIVEITFLIGNIVCLNMFSKCLRVTYHGEYDRAGKEDKR